MTAEVDCVDEDNNTVDVTLVESEQEMTLSQDKILLVVAWDRDDMQERILLNLSRCLLQLADSTCQRSRRPLYLKSTVLGCTLVLALLDLRSSSSTSNDSKDPAASGSSNTNHTNRTKTALLLRGRAQTGLLKHMHARADFQRLSKLDPVEGRREMQRLERHKAKMVQTNQRLARNVSQWVQSVMQTKNNHPEEPAASLSLVSEAESKIGQRREFLKQAKAVPFLLSLIFGAFFAWYLQKHLGK